MSNFLRLCLEFMVVLFRHGSNDAVVKRVQTWRVLGATHSSQWTRDSSLAASSASVYRLVNFRHISTKLSGKVHILLINSRVNFIQQDNVQANLEQWRRDVVCRPGQMSVFAAPANQIRVFLGFRTSGCKPTFGVPSPSLPSYSLHFPLLSLPTLPFSISSP